MRNFKTFAKKEPSRSLDMRKIFPVFKWHLLFSLQLFHRWVIDIMPVVLFYTPKNLAIFIQVTETFFI